MAARRWAELTGPEMRGYLAGHPAEVGLLPVGATEQHGPHLPTGTDTIIACALADAVSAATGAPVLPALAVACSFGHGRLLGGTLSLTPEGLAESVRQVCAWAADSGLRRVLAINAHLGNFSALAVAADHLRLERPDLRFGVASWWEASPEVTAEVLADGRDVHANRAETALMMALTPELVRSALVADADDEDRTAGLVFGYTADSLSTNGVTGRPSQASADLGRRLHHQVVAGLCDLVERGRREEPPLVGHLPRPAARNQEATRC
jgi:creatinine amidohydrolase